MNEELHQAFLLVLADLAAPDRRVIGQTSNDQLLVQLGLNDMLV